MIMWGSLPEQTVRPFGERTLQLYNPSAKYLLNGVTAHFSFFRTSSAQLSAAETVGKPMVLVRRMMA